MQNMIKMRNIKIGKHKAKHEKKERHENRKTRYKIRITGET